MYLGRTYFYQNNKKQNLIFCSHSSVPENNAMILLLYVLSTSYRIFFAVVVYGLLCFSCCCCACPIHFFKCPSILHRRCFIYSFCVHTVVRLCAQLLDIETLKISSSNKLLHLHTLTHRQ